MFSGISAYFNIGHNDEPDPEVLENTAKNSAKDWANDWGTKVVEYFTNDPRYRDYYLFGSLNPLLYPRENRNTEQVENLRKIFAESLIQKLTEKYSIPDCFHKGQPKTLYTVDCEKFLKTFKEEAFMNMEFTNNENKVAFFKIIDDAYETESNEYTKIDKPFPNYL